MIFFPVCAFHGHLLGFHCNIKLKKKKKKKKNNDYSSKTIEAVGL